MLPKVVKREIKARRRADARKGGRMSHEQTIQWNGVRHYGRFTPIWKSK